MNVTGVQTCALPICAESSECGGSLVHGDGGENLFGANLRYGRCDGSKRLRRGGRNHAEPGVLSRGSLDAGIGIRCIVSIWSAWRGDARVCCGVFEQLAVQV